MDNVNLVKEWILNSGIQNADGGFYAWYDLINKNYSFVYSEITGYGITTLLYMKNIEKAKAAANWLIKNAFHKCGGFKTKYFTTEKSFINNYIYTFDTGMILFGLINLFKATKDTTYLDTSIKVADFLIRCQKRNGLFYPIYDTKTDSFVENKEKWSTQSGGYHAKTSLAMIELFNVTKKRHYKKCAEKICNATLKLQGEDGKFIIGDETHFHPHCYSAEGLLYSGIRFNNKKFITSTVSACEFALDNQLNDGGIPFLFTKGKFISYQRSDILAQVLRLGCILLSLGELDKKYIVNLNNLKNRLCEFQHKTGGFLFGTDFDGEPLNHLNSWCSMFAFQALDMYEKSIVKKEKVFIDLFI